ncbi:MAG: hypothetical protein M9894_04985 [Planctomycetes bacterium]|nr:hypothetical protein [Planctomycetota bacterium]
MSRPRRRRGATFTLVALATSTLLLVSAGIFLRSAGHGVQLAGLTARKSAAREAAFAAVAWAARDAEATGAADGTGELLLDQGLRATVRYALAAPGSDDLAVTVHVEGLAGDPPVTLLATLARRDGRYALVRFE